MTVATLTRDQILAMPAGREMDFAIQEHVFGWMRQIIADCVGHPGPAETAPHRPALSHPRSSPMVEMGFMFTDDSHGDPYRVPPYSTSDAAALEVVKPLTDKFENTAVDGDTDLAHFWCIFPTAEGWRVTITDGLAAMAGASTPSDDFADVTCDSLALAICRAALLAELSLRSWAPPAPNWPAPAD